MIDAALMARSSLPAAGQCYSAQKMFLLLLPQYYMLAMMTCRWGNEPCLHGGSSSLDIANSAWGDISLSFEITHNGR
jgi:hypothetical protein